MNIINIIHSSRVTTGVEGCTFLLWRTIYVQYKPKVYKLGQKNATSLSNSLGSTSTRGTKDCLTKTKTT